MQPAEAVLVHQVHPAKTGADITASVVSDVPLWKHKPRIAVAVRVLLPAVGSAAVLGLADLGALARTRPGQYVLDHMPPSAQAVRLAGDAVMGSRGLPPQPGPAAPRRGPSRGRLVSCGVAAAVQAPMTPNTANAYRAARQRRTASSGRAENHPGYNQPQRQIGGPARGARED